MKMCGMLAAGVVGWMAMGPVARGDEVFRTEDPGGFFGYIGFDIFPQQSVAARFIPGGEFTLDSVSIWFMSNDFTGQVPQTVTVTLRTDVDPGGDFDSAPSGVVLETWTRNISAVGWNPVLEAYASEVHSPLHAGQRYWVVTESNVAAGDNPIWVWSAVGNEFTATREGASSPWSSGFGAAVGIRVAGTPVHVCTADFDHDGDTGTDADIEAFFACLAGMCCATCDTADFDGDGDTGTDADIEAFFRVMAGGEC